MYLKEQGGKDRTTLAGFETFGRQLALQSSLSFTASVSLTRLRLSNFSMFSYYHSTIYSKNTVEES